MTIPQSELLDRRSTPPRTDLDRAADELIDRSEVACPHCDLPDAVQIPVFVGQDGALDRADFVCGHCGTEHPIWFG